MVMSERTLNPLQCDGAEIDLESYSSDIEDLERLPQSELSGLLGVAAMACLRCQLGEEEVPKYDDDGNCMFEVATGLLVAAGANASLEADEFDSFHDFDDALIA
jgi:hypothetical protein